jgi:hypothetical protein
MRARSALSLVVVIGYFRQLAAACGGSTRPQQAASESGSVQFVQLVNKREDRGEDVDRGRTATSENAPNMSGIAYHDLLLRSPVMGVIFAART